MHPALLFLIAIFSPVALAVALLLPPYVAICAATYIIYDKGAAHHPLTDPIMNGDVFYMVRTYRQSLEYWLAHMADAPLLTYSLPVLVLPALGLLLTQWLLRKLVGKLRDVFEMATFGG